MKNPSYYYCNFDHFHYVICGVVGKTLVKCSLGSEFKTWRRHFFFYFFIIFQIKCLDISCNLQTIHMKCQDIFIKIKRNMKLLSFFYFEEKISWHFLWTIPSRQFTWNVKTIPLPHQKKKSNCRVLQFFMALKELILQQERDNWACTQVRILICFSLQDSSMHVYGNHKH